MSKQVIICHVRGTCIGVATSGKQKDEIVKAFYDKLHGKHGDAGLTVEFTYVPVNTLNPVFSSIVDKPILFPFTPPPLTKKKWIVWVFILGCDPKTTRRFEIVEAYTASEAERLVGNPYEGWGVLGSREFTPEDEDREIAFDLF